MTGRVLYFSSLCFGPPNCGGGCVAFSHGERPLQAEPSSRAARDQDHGERSALDVVAGRAVSIMHATLTVDTTGQICRWSREAEEQRLNFRSLSEEKRQQGTDQSTPANHHSRSLCRTPD